jgi:hypothetical protein
MHQAAPFQNFANACEHLLVALATNHPLANSQARIVERYCKEILAIVQSNLHTEADTARRGSNGSCLQSDPRN